MTGQSERGAILIVTLGLMLVLSAVCVSLLTFVRLETKAAATLSSATQMRALADGGVERGVAALLANDPALRRNGSPFAFELDDSVITVRISDERGKIDLNAAPRALLVRFFSTFAQNDPSLVLDPTQAADAILARRAEGRFASVYQLSGLPQIDRAAAKAIAPFVTIAPVGAKINPDTAPRAVLAAIPGLSDGEIEAILDAQRLGRPAPAVARAGQWLARREGPLYTVEAEVRSENGAAGSVARLVWLRETGDVVFLTR